MRLFSAEYFAAMSSVGGGTNGANGHQKGRLVLTSVASKSPVVRDDNRSPCTQRRVHPSRTVGGKLSR